MKASWAHTKRKGLQQQGDPEVASRRPLDETTEEQRLKKR